MKNKGVVIQIGLLLVISFGLSARELRTPWTVQNPRGYIHYGEPRPKDDDTCWNVDWWGADYAKTADKAYSNCKSTKTGNISGVWFGREDFTLLDAFAPGTYDPANPLLGVLQFRPRFDFSEQGAYFGMNVDRGYCCGRWHFGGRTRIAVRSLKTELQSCCDLVETLDDVRRMDREQVQSNIPTSPQSQNDSGLEVIENSYAYRLDLIAALPMTSNEPADKLLKFADATKNNHITINQIDVTLAGPGEGDTTSGALNVGTPVHVARRTALDGVAGSLTDPFSASSCDPCNSCCKTEKNLSECALQNPGYPNLPYALVNAQEVTGGVNGYEDNLPVLAADGAGPFSEVQNNLRAKFGPSVNYTGLGSDAAAQRDLWLVPTARNIQTVLPDQTVHTYLDLTEGARSIQTAIENVLKSTNLSVLGFLNSNCITFDSQTESGLADLDLDLYAQRFWCWGYLEGWIGVRFPTGKRIDQPNKLLLIQAPGNNRHFEFRFGGEVGYEPTDWCNIEVGAYFSHAFTAKERVAASFAGATVKNIGPAIEADISWNYFVGNADFTFRPPCNPQVGVAYGYQIYAKQHDQIQFCATTAKDLLGNEQPLDPSVLEERTHVVAHKFRAEGFMQTCYGELFLGWSRVFAGKNAMRESDYYVGYCIYF